MSSLDVHGAAVNIHENPVEQNKPINVGGVLINPQLAHELSKEIFGIDLSYQLKVNNSRTTVGSHSSDGDITFSSHYPAAMMISRLKEFQNILEIDLGLNSLSMSQTGDWRAEISKEQHKVVLEEVDAPDPANLIISNEKGYARDSMKKYAELLKKGYDSIELESEKEKYIIKHLEKYMKISEASIKACYQGALVHEMQHSAYQTKRDSSFSLKNYLQNPKEYSKDDVYKALSGLVLTTASAVGLVGMETIYKSITHSYNYGPNMEIPLQFSMILFAIMLGKAAQDFAQPKLESSLLTENENLAYKAQSEHWQKFENVVTIDRNELYKKVFVNPPKFVPN